MEQEQADYEAQCRAEADAEADAEGEAMAAMAADAENEAMIQNEMARERAKLNLYVWEDVLADYTSGMAVAYAPDVETALRLLSEKAGYDLELPISKMKKVTEAEAFLVYGRG